MLLREQISRWGPTAGIVSPPEDILVTNGCTEAYHLALKAVCSPGDTVAVEIPSHPQEGMDLEVLRFALDHHPIRAVLLVANHNNPQGSVLSDERKRQLVGLLEARGVPLVEDDVYGDLGFGSQRPLACKSYDRTGNVLYCNSFSKSLVNLTTASILQRALGAYLNDESYEKHLRKLRPQLAARWGASTRPSAGLFPPEPG